MPNLLPGMSDGSRPHLNEVELAGVAVRVRGPVQTEIINIQGRKVNIGDPGPDDHPVNSSIIQTSYQGGGQVWKMNPGQDMQRFWWATLMTEYPEYLTLPPLTHTFTTPTGANPIIVGDYPNDATAKLYAAGGGKFLRFNNGTQVFDDL